jgi:hypothetical protein
LNFGHGRRNNLVKLAEQYKTRRSASLVVNDVEKHKQRLDEILGRKKEKDQENIELQKPKLDAPADSD